MEEPEKDFFFYALCDLNRMQSLEWSLHDYRSESFDSFISYECLIFTFILLFLFYLRERHCGGIAAGLKFFHKNGVTVGKLSSGIKN